MKIAIIGFGMMGRQIAQAFAQHGHSVRATDESRDILKSGLDEIANGPYGLRSSVQKGKMSEADAADALERIAVVPSLEDAVKDADLVLEAVYENLELKQHIFRRLELASPNEALLASNTSTLSIAKISDKVSRKDRVLGIHFFNPAQVSKLVEIVKSKETSSKAVDQVLQLTRTIGKIPIITRDEPGFVANRLGLSLYVEASRMFEQGIASVQDIDTAMKLGYNHPMGPFELADFVGLDTRLRNLEALFSMTGDEKWIPPKSLRQMVNQGYLGDPVRKIGSKGGYYTQHTAKS
jgi:3-hydroxybutyryl-CoA dehydrogenase